MGFPRGLAVTLHPPESGWDGYEGPVVVFVHGSLDRGASFSRSVRRLRSWGAVTYDRRGYQGSRELGATDLGGHIDDLLEIVAALPDEGAPKDEVTVVGHSVGGAVAVGAAIATPRAFCSLGAYEPPMPWLGLPRPQQPTGGPGSVFSATFGKDPGLEAERFFGRMVGETTWHRLTETAREERRADGPALVADLLAIRGPEPFDVTHLSIPAVFGRSGEAGRPHHRATVAWLVDHVPNAELFEIAPAGHGAHLSHPGAFTDLVERAVALGNRLGKTPGARGVH